MKILRYITLVLAVVLLAYTLVCYYGPKNLNISETLAMEAPPSVVFNVLNDITRTEEWNDWIVQDTGMIITYSENTIGVGAKSEWANSKFGNGKQEIVESVENEKIKTKLNFEDWEGDNFAEFLLIPNGNGTELTWNFEGTPIPFFYRGVFFTGKNTMRKSYKAGLNNLKRITTQRMNGQYDGYKISEVNLAETHYVMRRQEVKAQNIQQFYATNLGQLFGKVQEAGLEMSGMPCGLLFRLDERDGMIDMAAAIPIPVAQSFNGASTLSIDAKKALQVDYYGEYNDAILAHNAVQEYMKDRKLHEDAPIIEEYVTDPGTEPDPSKWLTRITYYYSE